MKTMKLNYYNVSKETAHKLTMDKMYGDGSNHEACEECGRCKECKDCKCKVKSEDRFMLCENINNGYCKVIRHEIRSGQASKIHCGKCKYFKERKEVQNE